MSDVYTVTELTRAIKQALAAAIGECQVEGEVSKLTAHRSGHWYFTVGDDDSMLSCVMFRGNNQFMRWRPQVGERVLLSGTLDVYGPRGSYSLIVRHMRRAGVGDLAAALEALKRKLAAEGLFDPARKQPLPGLPGAIGVATSPTGAALQDILKVLGRRFPGVAVYLAPCRVQGAEAPAEIVAAIDLLAQHGKSDVIIVGRGGGSQEDLACFNDERVARAIAECPIPVVSAVGHEVDTSIADLVADVRAATPSHAAELVVPERESLLLLLDDLDERARAAMVRRLGRHRDVLKRLVVRDPRRGIDEGRRRLDELSVRLVHAGRQDLAARRSKLDAHGAHLRALSPLAVLGRGYAVVFKDGRAVLASDDLSTGDKLQLRLHQGHADVTVDAT